MDAFEAVVSDILWREGYWVRTSVFVELTPEEKDRIQRRNSPRWELDVVGYRAKDNVLLVGECKSYLDSPGVRISALDGSDNKSVRRFKLFNDRKLRQTVLNRLVVQLHAGGWCPRRPKPSLELFCGKIASSTNRCELERIAARNEWTLRGPDWIQHRLRAMSSEAYSNQVPAVVSKLLLRS